jgi:hypothetical protein
MYKRTSAEISPVRTISSAFFLYLALDAFCDRIIKNKYSDRRVRWMLRLRNHINIEIVLLHDSRNCMTMSMLKPCDTFIAYKEELVCHIRTHI